MRGGVWQAAALLMTITFTATSAGAGAAAEKIKFPYSPMSWNSLPWWMAKDAGHFERNGLDVDLFYEGASAVIVQAMLAGEANFGGLAGPAIVSNVIGGGDVIQFAAVVKRSSCRCSRRTYDTHSLRQAFRAIHN
jgi:NitT/TauT family transport system substrate-binding protein